MVFLQHLTGLHEEWFLLLQRHYPYQLANENEACRNHLTTICDTSLNLYKGTIQRGQEDGSFRADLPPNKTVLLMFAMVNGLIWLNLISFTMPLGHMKNTWHLVTGC